MNLIVVDLDHTLIGVDSFNLYIKKKIKQGSTPALFLKTLRVLRLISLSAYKRMSILWLAENDSSLEVHINSLQNKINKTLLRKIKNKYQNFDNKVIIMSASPHLYVKPLGELFQLEAYGSHFSKDGKWIHLHGKGKISFLNKEFPVTKYRYKYAISDSPSDSEFLYLFEESDLIQPYKSCYV